eukprot:TRINITY_DN4587_c0_g1_i1.p8 TRINITY_DN4587_c0_g1~~TRINITY_DN4587_c0_g1_i1.p8  ORF type:complete len:106 (-),score=0.09 TRINITY_DN4587_c0_g1_i1:1869-2186(-)
MTVVELVLNFSLSRVQCQQEILVRFFQTYEFVNNSPNLRAQSLSQQLLSNPYILVDGRNDQNLQGVDKKQHIYFEIIYRNVHDQNIQNIHTMMELYILVESCIVV